MSAAPKTIQMYPVNDEPISKAGEAPIPGGFYLMARKIEESEIAHAAPVIREVWAWILRQCNHKEKEGIKRGQCVRRIADMQEGLHWFVGYRKMEYSKTQCENALEFLRKKQMITTTKTTRGLVITVCKYDTYQNPKNYEDNSEGNKKTTSIQQQGATINKNGNNENNEKNSSTPPKQVWRFSHNGFFDRQIASNQAEPEINNYITLVEYLHGNNADGIRFDNVLSLSKQISYKDFVQLKEVAKTSGRTIKEVLTAMENRATLKKDYKNVYLTAKNWLQTEFKK